MWYSKMLKEKISYRCRLATLKDAEELSQLSFDVFHEFILPFCHHEGLSFFYTEMHLEAIRKRLRTGAKIILADDLQETIGFIEVKPNNHISSLFIKKKYHRRGVGKALLFYALSTNRCRNKSAVFSLNASYHGHPLYQAVGFKSAGPALYKNGIFCQPMLIEIPLQK